MNLSVLSLLALSLAAAQQAPSPPAIRVESALVNVPVIVSDLKGRYVPGLKLADFRLYQDGQPQAIELFRASEEPIRIGLLLDTSKSTVTVLGKIKKAAREFLLNVRPQDQAFVVSFDSEVRYLSPFSSDPRELAAAINEARVGEYTGTKMRDAIMDALHREFRTFQGRKALVVLTDGQDYGSAASAEDLLAAIASSNVIIYPIHYKVDPRKVMKKLFGVRSRLPAYKPGETQGPYKEWDEAENKAAAYLAQLADLSAGRFFRSNTADLKQAFGQVAEELRYQYLLGFYPDKSKLDGEEHYLEVKVSLHDVVVRARRSYRSAK